MSTSTVDETTSDVAQKQENGEQKYGPIDSESDEEDEANAAVSLKAIDDVRVKMNEYDNDLAKYLEKFSKTAPKIMHALHSEQINELTAEEVEEKLKTAQVIKRDLRLAHYNYGLANQNSLRLLYALDNIRGNKTVKANRKAQVTRIQASEDACEITLIHMKKTLKFLDQVVHALEQRQATVEVAKLAHAADVTNKIEIKHIQEESTAEVNKLADAAEAENAQTTTETSSNSQATEDSKETAAEDGDSVGTVAEQDVDAVSSPLEGKDEESSEELLLWARKNLRRVNPRVRSKQTRTYVELQMDLPGMKSKDVTLEVTGSTLIVSGVHRPSFRPIYDVYGRRAFALDSFVREAEQGYWFQKEFEVSDSIDATTLSAGFEQGVLVLRLPFNKDFIAQQEYAQSAPHKRRREQRNPFFPEGFPMGYGFGQPDPFAAAFGW